MLGLMYLSAAALYLIVMSLTVRWAWRRGRAASGSVRRGISFASLGFLAIYLPVFWNHIPVLLVQHARCAKDAGFTTLMTPDEWAQTNRDVLGALRGVDLNKSTPPRSLPSGFSRSEYFGGALADESRSESKRMLGVVFNRYERRLLDVRTGAILNLEVRYSIGPRDDARAWLIGHECPPRVPGAMSPMVKYDLELKERIK